jgi:phosphohistidine phosphatase
MKKLCLIRHAKSEWAHEGLDDIDRPLNERGYADARSMSIRLKASGIHPNGLYSSTAIRAASTALIFARTFGLDEKQCLFTSKLYGADEEDFLEVLRSLPGTWETVLVFGHNETISMVANRLGGSEIGHLPTCGTVTLETSIPRWAMLGTCKLLQFDFPKKVG